MSSGYEDLEELKDNLCLRIRDLEEAIQFLKEMIDLIDTAEWKLGMKDEET